MKYTGIAAEYFEVTILDEINQDVLNNAQENELSLLWFQTDNNKIRVDAVEYTFNKNDIVCLTEFHKVEDIDITQTKFLRWNKQFYCIVNHDSEVSCRGILFYGAAELPVIHASLKDIETLSSVWKMLESEMKSQDNLQEEMLQMMLKRILILCTRMYKKQSPLKNLELSNIDIIREYNFHVEQNFKSKHTVSEYAELMFKSPKTLSNIFKKLGTKTPLQFIQDRKMLEARRLLSYTDMSVSEVGFEIGFIDVQSFSRFFKKQEGLSPVDFRK